ncbi:Metallo-dependent phosphatase-like protein [Morchella snyderi]|nr:Metallo-dependent phosphatase-like protein [Morchella snyderi]
MLSSSPYRPTHSKFNSDPSFLGQAWAQLRRHKAWRPLQRRKGQSWKSKAVEALSIRNAVRLSWVLLVWWGERTVFESAIRECAWENWEDWPTGATPHRMALIADPQIIDPHTYPRRGLSLAATIYYTDQYMRRSYSTLQEILLPSTTLFLGDLFDGGREWAHTPPSLYAQKQHIHTSDGPVAVRPDPNAEADWKLYKDDYWWGEYLRFARIFPGYPYRRTVKSLPGNHDLGIGNGIREPVKERFTTWFGETSSVVEAGNHSIVLLDSVSLSNDNNPRIFKPEREFLDDLPARLSKPDTAAPKYPHAIISDSAAPPADSAPNPETLHNHLPTILLTHVPLYRPPNTPCGPQRESSNPISIRGGYQYQNVLTPELSSDILQKTSAKYVFSGDDHDYCEVDHMYTGDQGRVHEVTIKSFAWTMGIRKPGFLLVSLWNPEDGPLDSAAEEPTLKSKLCLLPDQIGTFLCYVKMLFGTLVLLAVTVLVRRVRGIASDEDPLLPTVEREREKRREWGSVGVSSSSAASRNGSRAPTPRVWGEEDKYLKPAVNSSVGGRKRKGVVGYLKDFGDEVAAVACVVLGFYAVLLMRW